MLNYKNEKIDVKGCPGCAYARGEFSLPCGMAYESDLVTMSQDWELPIPAFFVVSPKRCVETLEELSDEEKEEIGFLIDKTIQIARKNNICDRFNVIFEEKEGRHFHVWMMPRHKWMEEKFSNITGHIGDIFSYAKENMRTDVIYEEIDTITAIVKKELFDIKVKKRIKSSN